MPGGGFGRCGRGGPVAGLESRRALRGPRFDSSIFRSMEDELGWSQARLLSGVRPTRSRGSTPPPSATCSRTPWCDGCDPHRCPSSRSPPGLLSLRGRVRLSGGASHHRYPCPRPPRRRVCPSCAASKSEPWPARDAPDSGWCQWNLRSITMLPRVHNLNWARRLEVGRTKSVGPLGLAPVPALSGRGAPGLRTLIICPGRAPPPAARSPCTRQRFQKKAAACMMQATVGSGAARRGSEGTGAAGCARPWSGAWATAGNRLYHAGSWRRALRASPARIPIVLPSSRAAWVGVWLSGPGASPVTRARPAEWLRDRFASP
jgi:hypothetical protein